MSFLHKYGENIVHNFFFGKPLTYTVTEGKNDAIEKYICIYDKCVIYHRHIFLHLLDTTQNIHT